MNQKVYKFRAATLTEAYKQMRRRLGEEAHVIRTEQVPVKGFLGLLGRQMAEVTASPARARRAAAPRANRSTAERRYTEGLNPSGSLAEDPRSAYYEKLLTDAQKRISQVEQETVATPASANPVSKPRSRSAAQRQPSAQGQPPGRAQPNPTVVPFPKQEAAPENAEGMRKQISDMREMLQVLMTESPGAGLPPEFAPHYRQLIQGGISRKVAASLVASAGHETNAEVIRDPVVFQERLKVEIRKRIEVTGGISLTPGVCKLVALVGATGVGKTTSLAKLAALYALRERARVAVITADTYRVGATDQLMKYANIIGIPMKVAHDAKEMAAARKEFADYDLVLMDTAGGSQFNTKQLQELKLVLTAAQPDEVSLVLSSSTQYDDLRSIAANFGCLKLSSLLFTKLDETRQFGSLFSVLTELNLPLGYLSIGQNVPDDLVLAHPGMIANLILEGRDRRGRPSSASA
jgi:flagellar biosynthesis protein FlhF